MDELEKLSGGATSPFGAGTDAGAGTPTQEPAADPAAAEQGSPDEAAAPASKDTSAEQCVPLAALSMPDADEQLANPEVGDPVSYQIEGKVTRVEGGMAYVQPTSINGQEVTPEAEKPEQPEDEPAGEEAAENAGNDADENGEGGDFADLRDMAKKQGSL